MRAYVLLSVAVCLCFGCEKRSYTELTDCFEVFQTGPLKASGACSVRGHLRDEGTYSIYPENAEERSQLRIGIADPITLEQEEFTSLTGSTICVTGEFERGELGILFFTDVSEFHLCD